MQYYVPFLDLKSLQILLLEDSVILKWISNSLTSNLLSLDRNTWHCMTIQIKPLREHPTGAILSLIFQKIDFFWKLLSLSFLWIKRFRFLFFPYEVFFSYKKLWKAFLKNIKEIFSKVKKYMTFCVLGCHYQVKKYSVNVLYGAVNKSSRPKPPAS